MNFAEHLLSLPSPPVLDVLGKFVHLRNARTGTTSMDEGPLRGRCVMKRRDKHLWKTVWNRIIVPRMGTIQDDPVVFTFVRNPWDRICSAFHQCRDRASTPDNQIARSWDFKDWVKRVLYERGPGLNMHFAEQWPTAQGDVFVGRFENMAADWERLAEKIDVDPVLPHWNSAGQGDYVTHYDDETRQIIAEIYTQDIKRFGYEFGK